MSALIDEYGSFEKIFFEALPMNCKAPWLISICNYSEIFLKNLFESKKVVSSRG